MKMEIMRLDPLRTANVLAIVYGALMFAVMIVVVPIMLAVFALGGLGGGRGTLIVLGMFFGYPILGVVFGWLGGLLIGFIYNFVVNLTGGFLIDTRDLNPSGAATQIPPAA